MRAVILAVFLLTGASLSVAQGAEKRVYDLSIRGFTVGELTLNGSASSSQYSVASLIRNTGVSRMFRQFSYRGASSGRVRGGKFAPSRYEEKADTGRRSSTAVLEYRNGVPRVVSYASPRAAGPDAPDPASQGGTVDPLTAIYALMQDVPANRACNVDYLIFDGKRQSRIFMRAAGMSGGVPICKGQYQRLKGFTAEEVSRHRAFNFTLTYAKAASGTLIVEKVSFDSFYGTAVIERR